MDDFCNPNPPPEWGGGASKRHGPFLNPNPPQPRHNHNPQKGGIYVSSTSLLTWRATASWVSRHRASSRSMTLPSGSADTTSSSTASSSFITPSPLLASLPSTSTRSPEPKQHPALPLLGFCAAGVVGALWVAAASGRRWAPGSEMAGIGRRDRCFVQGAGCHGGGKGKHYFVQQGTCHEELAAAKGYSPLCLRLDCSTGNKLFV